MASGVLQKVNMQVRNTYIILASHTTYFVTVFLLFVPSYNRMIYVLINDLEFGDFITKK